MAEALRETRTPFLRLNAGIGWRLAPKAQRPGVPHEDRPLQLAVEGVEANPLAEPFGSFGGRTLPRGLAISGEGRVFLADPEARVIWTALAGGLGADTGGTWPFRALWPARDLPSTGELGGGVPDPYTLVRPTDVKIAPNGDLVIADPGAGRLLVLTWPTGQIRHVIGGGTPEAVGFDTAGRGCVLDPASGALRVYDRFWRPVSGFPHASVSLSAPWAVATPVACRCAGTCGCAAATAPAPVLYLLDGKTLVALAANGRQIEPPADPALCPGPITRDADGTLSWQDPARPGLDPIRLKGLVLTTDGRHAGTGRPLLSVPRRVSVPRSGRILTEAIDGGRPGFAWDRLAFTVDLPKNTRMVVTTTTSDSPIEIDRIEALPESAWSRPLALGPGDLPEVLIQSPGGRNLWLRVELFGDGRSSPAISEIDLFAPRQTALRHLPVPFHQDPESARFLDRFLSYFDTVFAEVSARHRDVAALFDPQVTPEGFLDWLGAWFDFEFAASLPEATRREMIAGAIPYFRQRGTVAGLRQILQWHLGLTDPMPQIVEHFRLPPGPVMIGGRDLEPGSPAHSFTVVFPAHAVPDDGALTRTERLIAASVPAHTRFGIRTFRPALTVAHQSTIGVDTLLGSLAPGPLGTTSLGGTFATPGPAGPDIIGASHATRRSQAC